MEKRTQKRMKTHQLAKVCGKTAVINNISATGMQVSTPLLPKTRTVDICLDAPDEEIILIGTVKWFERKNTLNHLHRLGITVKNAPPEFYQMVESLNRN